MPGREPRKAHPVHPNDVVCDTCTERSAWMDTEAATWERARILGWKLYRGLSLGGTELVRRICPTCWSNGSPAPKVKARDPLVGQMDLPGLITPVPVEKKKGTKSKRQMS
jgi:hypothetical protein